MKISKQVTDTQKIETPEKAITPKWGWVEASIWTESMLTALENGVKGNKWYSLIDKAYRPHTLENAWSKVKANKGSAGVDKITISKFENQKELYLKELELELKNGSYNPKAVKRVYIPKGQGKLRSLGIPTVKDRVAQQAIKMVIEPIFEKEFLDMSYGFRPNKNAHMAIKEVTKLIKEGYTWVVDADLQAYFDTIPHDKLMTKVKQRISDGNITKLLEQWLEQEIMDECEIWVPTTGTPQGAIISPLLSNIYLHDLDLEVTRKGFKMLRYADDFIILSKTKSEAEAALKVVQTWVAEHGLILHPEKTHLGNCMVKGEGFDFLGYRFEEGTSWIRHKSIQKFRDKVRELTSKVGGKSIKAVINKLNLVLRGWSKYFKYVTKYTLSTYDSFVRRRLRAIVQRQNKKRSFGAGWCNVTMPNKYFADRGLFNMEESQRISLASESR